MRDNTTDRETGKKWEKGFREINAWYGKPCFLYQEDRTTAARWQHGHHFGLMPDLQIFNVGPEAHELKHKSASRPRKGEPCYGLEAYRLKHLVEFQRAIKQPVFYTIHDWRVAGARTATEWMPNVLQDWRVARIDDLHAYVTSHPIQEQMKSWVNGAFANCQGYYWPESLWTRLDLHWGLPA